MLGLNVWLSGSWHALSGIGMVWVGGCEPGHSSLSPVMCVALAKQVVLVTVSCLGVL